MVNLTESYELVEQLCEHAMGVNTDYTAADLIANHRVCLLRRDFAPFIQRGHYLSGGPMAAIRWRPPTPPCNADSCPALARKPTCCASPPASARASGSACVTC